MREYLELDIDFRSCNQLPKTLPVALLEVANTVCYYFLLVCQHPISLCLKPNRLLTNLSTYIVKYSCNAMIKSADTYLHFPLGCTPVVESISLGCCCKKSACVDVFGVLNVGLKGSDSSGVRRWEVAV